MKTIRGYVDELERLIDIASFLRADAQWTNGYRTGNPKKEAELYPKEMNRWKQYGNASDDVAHAIRRLTYRVERRGDS